MATEVWAVGMMRDEGDVAFTVLAHLADEGVDGIVVADNRSSDDTPGELRRAANELDIPVVVIEDPEVGYYQSRKMTGLAARAAELGAEWIVPFDADELWFAHDDRLAVVLREVPSSIDVVEAVMFNHFATALDLDDPCPFRSMVYRQVEPNPMHKVAFRWHPSAVIGQGNHSVTFDHPVSSWSGGLEIRHFPYRSANHFRRKAINGLEAYRATDLPESEGAHWRQYGQLLERHGEDALDEVFRTWFWFLAPCNAGMVHDPAPCLRWTSAL